MYKISVNEKESIAVDKNSDGSFSLNGEHIKPDIVEVRNGTFHVIINNKSYNAEVIDRNDEEKTFSIRVNNNIYKLKVSDRYDALLKELGLDALQAKKASDLKAPMPGLVVEVSVAVGDTVSKGDKLLVLEAMKMENILKAQSDAIVKKVNITKGNTVEKNEVLILFE